MKKQLKNPPIKEAIFTFHFNDNIEADKLWSFRNSSFVAKEFKINDPIFSISITNPQKQQGSDSIITSHNEEGFVLKRNEKSNNLIRVLPTHLSYHSFNKYAGWEEMCSELNTVWSEFCVLVGNPSLSKISVRYINQISLPIDEKLEDIVRLLPSVPEGIQADNNFFLQINVSSDDGTLKGVITETFLPNKDEEKRKIFLIDINVSSMIFLGDRNNLIWNVLNSMREYKNELFFSCITEKTTIFFN